MKKQQNTSAYAFALRIALAFALTSISAVLLASTLRPAATGPRPDRPTPDIVTMLGPVSQNQDLRTLRYIAPNEESEERRLSRHPFPLVGGQIQSPPSFPGQQFTKQLMNN